MWLDVLIGGADPPREGSEAEAETDVKAVEKVEAVAEVAIEVEVAETEEEAVADVAELFFGIRKPAAKPRAVAVELEDAEAEPARSSRSRRKASSVSVTPMSTVRVSAFLGGGRTPIPLGTAAPCSARTKPYFISSLSTSVSSWVL